MMLLGLAAATAPWSRIRITQSVALCDVFFTLAGLLFWLQPRHEWGGLRKPAAYLLLIPVGGLIGTIIANTPSHTLIDLLRFSVAALGVFAIVAWANPSEREVRLLLWSFALGSVVSSAQGSATYFGRLQGLAAQPNLFAIPAFLGFVSVVSLMRPNSRRTTVVCAFLALVLLYGVIRSGSRAGLVGILLFLLLLLIVRRRNISAVGPIIAAVLILGMLLLGGVVTISSSSAVARLIDDTPSTQASDRIRAQSRDMTWQQIREDPVAGVGFKNPTIAHNFYLQILSVSGIIGLLGWALVAGRLLRLWRTSTKGNKEWLSLCLTSGAVTWLVTSAESNDFWGRYIWLYLAITLVVGWRNATRHERRQEFLKKQQNVDA